MRSPPLAPRASSLPRTAPRRQRFLFCLVQAAPLTAFLLVLRIEHAVAGHLALDGRGWLWAIAIDLSFAVGFSGALGAVGVVLRPDSRWARVWSVGAGLSVLSIYAVASLAAQFLLHTGTPLELDLAVYALLRWEQFGGLVGTGVDTRLALNVLLGGGAFLAGRLLAGRIPNRREALPAMAPLLTVAASVGLLLTSADLAPGRVASTSSPPVSSLLSSYKDAASGRASRARIGPPDGAFYEAPELLRPPDRRPNIVLVLLESTRVDVTPPYASDAAAHAPFLDRFARRAAVVRRMYTSVPHTSKALVGILCGMYPTLQRPIVEAHWDELPLRCLPHLLEQVGYRTGFFQTAEGGFEDRPELLRNLGFSDGRVQEDYEADGFERVGYFGMDEFAMLEPVLDWVRKARGSEAPFFLTVLTVTPHHPYQAPGEPVPSRSRLFEAYLRAIRHQDRFVRALYERLGEIIELEETVVLVLGDHGEAFGEHGRHQHNVVPYEEVIRTPLLIETPPWAKLPERISGLRHHADLLPTFVDLLGMEVSGTLPGRSLLGSRGHGAVASFCWHERRCAALVTPDLKFVYHFGSRPLEVFRLASDPEESRDLSGQLPRSIKRAARNTLLRRHAAVGSHYRDARAANAGRGGGRGAPPRGRSEHGSRGAAPTRPPPSGESPPAGRPRSGVRREGSRSSPW